MKDPLVRRRYDFSLIGSHTRTALLAVLALLFGLLLVRPAGSASSTQDFSGLATAISSVVASKSGVTVSSGGYVPGSGVVVVSGLTGVEQDALTGLLGSALAPFIDQLAELPESESVSWQVTLTGSTQSTWLVRVPAGSVTDASAWATVELGVAGAVTPAATAAPPASTVGAAAVAGSDGSAAATTSASPAAATPSAATSVAAAGAGTTSAGTDTPTTSATAAEVAADGPLTDDFSGAADAWQPMTGTWRIQDGTYQQTNEAGFDFISAFTSPLPSTYSVTVTMKGLGDTVNGGLVLGLPDLASRKGGVMVDLAGADYVRWGNYDPASGNYTFIGGANIGAQQDPAQVHTLTVKVAKDMTTVYWDTKRVGSLIAVSGGHLGLVTSNSAVSFDDFAVTAS